MKIYCYKIFIYDLIDFFRKKDLFPVFIFIAITGIIHIVWNIWEDLLLFWPFQEQILSFSSLMVKQVFYHSLFFILRVDSMTVIEPQNLVYIFEEGGTLTLFPGCSGLKQMIQFSGLIAIIGGKYIHKLWFIPAGVIIIHLINIIRITGLATVILYIPEMWEISHDHIFKIIFYVGIFLLWLSWNFINRNKIIKGISVT